MALLAPAGMQEVSLAAMGWGLGLEQERSCKGVRVEQGIGAGEASKKGLQSKGWRGRHQITAAVPERGCGSYTQGVLDIDEPTIETKKLSDLDQPIGHRLVGALIPSQEGFAELATLLPLCDKGPCET